MKVLVLDDDIEIAGFLKDRLPAAGFVVDVAHTGADGITKARVNRYDLLLLDLRLPDMSGEEIIEQLHRVGFHAPILMLTVMNEPQTRVRILNAGADDYLSKPFLYEELLARMRALLRRSDQITPDVLTADTLTLDTRTLHAERDGREVLLTKKEFTLLEYLLRHKGSVVSKNDLIEHAWDSSANTFSGAIETHIANLRRKLGKPEIIQTVHSQGYRVLP